MEMFRTEEVSDDASGSFLHACGDVSLLLVSNNLSAAVFSTHVEMFPGQQIIIIRIVCFLHACGDVSSKLRFTQNHKKFSPRMWRCFFLCSLPYSRKEVFSTHVEMFPRHRRLSTAQGCFLHACGDVSS